MLQGERVFDNLIYGSNQLVVSDPENIATNDIGVRGQVMGKITGSGKWIKYKSGAGDGSEIPRGIAAEDYDATPSGVKSVIYKTGEFNENAIVFDGGDTLTEAVKNQFQDVNIHTKSGIDVDGVHNP